MRFHFVYENDLPPLGHVELKWHASASTRKLMLKRLRVQPALLTYPSNLSTERILKLLPEIPLYLYLKGLQESPVRNPILDGYRTRKHVIHIEQRKSIKTITSQFTSDHGICLFVPENQAIDSYRVQRIAYEYLFQFLQEEAYSLLRPYVAKCAQTLGLSYSKIKIGMPALKWGSCSSAGSLNFSAFAMLLPDEYLQYLVLHELTHLTHLNHSTAFWTLLSEYLDRDARVVEEAFNQYSSHSLPIPELF